MYLNLPNDTTGIANEMVEYLKQKKYNDGDVIHVWVFTDSTIIPKSFSGDWSTPKAEVNVLLILVDSATEIFLMITICLENLRGKKFNCAQFAIEHL